MPSWHPRKPDVPCELVRVAVVGSASQERGGYVHRLSDAVSCRACALRGCRRTMLLRWSDPQVLTRSLPHAIVRSSRCSFGFESLRLSALFVANRLPTGDCR